MTDTRALADAYLAEAGISNNKSYPLTNGKLYEFEKITGKSFLELEEEDFIRFFFDFAGIHSVSTLDVYRWLYVRFYQWCIDNGHTDKDDNLFEGNVELDPDTLAACMSRRCRLYYYDDGYIDKICSHIKKDKIYTEILIRLFYEGISSYDEIMYLKKSQVDFQTRTLLIEDRKVGISERLCRLMEKLQNGYVERYDNDSKRQIRYVRFSGEDVFLFRSAVDSSFNRRQFMSRRLGEVKRELSLEDFSVKKLYQSGLLQMIRKECGYDTDQLLHVLYEEKHKQTNYLLDQMLKKHGYKITSYRVRSLFKPYMMQLAAFRQNENKCS